MYLYVHASICCLLNKMKNDIWIWMLDMFSTGKLRFNLILPVTFWVKISRQEELWIMCNYITKLRIFLQFFEYY